MKPFVGPGALSVRTLPGGRLSAIAPVKLLVMYAYGLQHSEIVGGPDWINRDRYEIDAKAGQNSSRGELMGMLQNLLQQRFQLKVHREMRETSIYSLIVARGRRMLTASKSECSASESDTSPSAADSAIPCGQMRIVPLGSAVRMEGDRVPLSELIRVLAVTLDEPVVDKTDLSGLFDVRLHFGLQGPESQEPSVFSALQEQLGLKLESSKGAAKFLVIDQVERPSAN